MPGAICKEEMCAAEARAKIRVADSYVQQGLTTAGETAKIIAAEEALIAEVEPIIDAVIARNP